MGRPVGRLDEALAQPAAALAGLAALTLTGALVVAGADPGLRRQVLGTREAADISASSSSAARRLTTLLPAMTLADALETTRIHRVAGRTGARTALVTTRPCRALPHTISDVGRIGGG
jgi:Magnesium chelatase, subunit ChlI